MNLSLRYIYLSCYCTYKASMIKLISLNQMITEKGVINVCWKDDRNKFCQARCYELFSKLPARLLNVIHLVYNLTVSTNDILELLHIILFVLICCFQTQPEICSYNLTVYSHYLVYRIDLSNHFVLRQKPASIILQLGFFNVYFSKVYLTYILERFL